MAGILNISEATSLAVHAMAFLAGNCEKPWSTREISEALGVSGAHLSKVLQRLSKVGLVQSSRGPKGGFKLGRPAGRIHLLQVYESFEGRLVQNDCLLGSKVCAGDGCVFGGFLESVSHQLHRYLAETKLSELAHLCRRNGINA